jgi:hypothetical protein
MTAIVHPRVSRLLPGFLALFLGGGPSLLAQPADCTPRPPGLVGWWPGDGFTFDVAGTNHGTLQNGAAYATGLAGPAFGFDGVNGSMQVPNAAALNFGTNDFTAEAWIKVQGNLMAASKEFGVINKNPYFQGTPGWGIEISSWSSANSFVARWFNTGQSTWCTTCPGSATLSTDVWYHLAAVRSRSIAYFYVDGQLQQAVTNSAVALNVDNSQPLLIGRNSWGPSFPGLIDEVSLYDRALDPEEIAALHAAGSSGKCWADDPAPVFVAHPDSQTALVLGSATLTGAAMGVPRPEYQWLFNGAPLTNATNATLVLNNLSTNQAGDYALVATNLPGSAISAAAHLSVVLPSSLSDFQCKWLMCNAETHWLENITQ